MSDNVEISDRRRELLREAGILCNDIKSAAVSTNAIQGPESFGVTAVNIAGRLQTILHELGSTFES